VRDSRLQFWLAPYAEAGDQYFIDDVVLTRLDPPQNPGVLSAGEEGERDQPKEFALCQNYPNPFNPSTTIKYELPKSSMVRVSVYDILGREVSVLVNEVKGAGVHEVRFDGSNLASSVYLCRMQASGLSLRSGQPFVQTRKLLLVR